MTAFRTRNLSRQPNAGMALVVSLALIVLLTVAVLAFFSRATANRLVESSRANRVEAEQLAKTGTDYVTAGFLREIAANSLATTNNGIIIYQPNSAGFSQPQRPLASALATDTNFANLIRRSVNESVSGVGELNASSHNSATPSKNNRFVGVQKWNFPALLSGTGFVTEAQLPNWIYVNADGSVTGSPSTNAIGRFSYNVYDIGGLLDVNVAGYPANVPTTSIATLKGSLVGADLSAIPGIGSTSSANSFVQWRNITSGQNATSYLSSTLNSSTNGFTRTSPGDNRVLSRQDLIKLAKNGGYGIQTNALPYLTTFTRSLSAPSWTPTTPSGSSTDYFASRNSSTAPNRFIPNIRVTSEFTRRDGTVAKVGDPLINNKFPLSLLPGVGVSGPVAPATANSIQRDFGLVWNGADQRWTYCGPSGSNAQTSIKNIGEIGNREPNFFELLKAGIYSGSLGKNANNQIANVNALDSDPDAQIIQIGANLIDQYDTNSYPTCIAFSQNSAVPPSSFNFYGVENLPYLSRVYNLGYRLENDGLASDGVTVVKKPIVQFYYLPVVWNPHSNPLGAPSVGPNEFRFVALGSSVGEIHDDSGPPNIRTTPDKIFLNPAPDTGNGSGIKFSINASRTFGEPTFLTKAVGASGVYPDEQPAVPGRNREILGLYVGEVSAPDYRINDKNPAIPYQFSWTNVQPASTTTSPFVTFQLQYKAANGRWLPYFEMKNITVGVEARDNAADIPESLSFQQWWPQTYYVNSDPRTDRFGAFGASEDTNDTKFDPTNCKTIRTGTDPGYAQPKDKGLDPTKLGPGWVSPGDSHIGEFSDNKTDSTTRYSDADGVLRRADGAYASPGISITAGYPLRMSNPNSRPYFLDRPFRSIGEMGYASRGMPWKHLDFFTPESADAGLLDLFALNNTPPIMAGVLNLNTRRPVVLQAILQGTLMTEGNTTTISSSEAQTLANALVGRTTSAAAQKGPLLNTGNLATDFAQDVSYSTASFASIKRRREAPIRALSAVSNTRTWNFLVDVVAQSGRFVGSGTSAGDFVVEGEKRVWQSMAIDRYTGKVIAQESESVYE